MTRALRGVIGAALLAGAGGFLIGCGKDAPPRDEIPRIKNALARLESYYVGAYSGVIDTLLDERFRATSGDRGLWSAIQVGEEAWRFAGSSGRSFYYQSESGEAEVSFVYRSPDSAQDSLIPVKITFVKEDDDRWLVSGVEAVEVDGL